MGIDSYLITRDSSVDDWKVERPLIDASIFGRFVRKCRLEYIKLEFEAAGALWNLFKAIREPSRSGITPPSTHKDELFGLHSPYIPDTSAGMRILSQLTAVCLSEAEIEKLCYLEIQRSESTRTSNTLMSRIWKSSQP